MATIRYKQSEQLQQAEQLKAMLESLPVKLAEILLPEIEDMPNHNQVLRVANVNIAISVDFIQITPKRILINKTDGKELDLNLFVPEWIIKKESQTSHVDANGNRILYDREWVDNEGNVITEHTVTKYNYDDKNNIIGSEDIVEQLPILEPQAFLMPSIPYLMLFATQIDLPTLLQMFSGQFVQDNFEIWNKITL